MSNYFSLFKLSGDESSKLEQIRFISLNIFAFLLPFDKFYTTLILYVIIVITLIDFKWEKLKKIPRHFWLFQFVFLLSVSGYFYSSQKAVAGSLIERQLILFILPLLIPLAITITRERIRQLLITLSISSVMTVIGLFMYAFFTLYQLHLPLSDLFTDNFFNHKFSSPINIHASYLSLYLSFSAIFLITLLSQSSKLQKVLIAVCILTLSVGLLFLAARSILIYTLIVIAFVYPFFYVKNKIRFIVSLALVLLTSTVFIMTNKSMKDRFTTSIAEDVNFNSEELNLKVVEPRSGRWLAGLDVASKSLLIGHGTGDELIHLKEKYKEKGYVISYIDNYNVHSQYLSVLIKHGILGLLIFLFVFAYYFYLAIKSEDYIYITFLFGICFFFLTENVLDANKGIFYFAFFNTILGYYMLSKNKSLSNS